jgi:hypothetical protein
LIAGLISAKVARIYFWGLGVAYTIDVVVYFFGHLNTLSLKTNFLANLPHIIIFIAAFWVAIKVGAPVEQRA